MCNAKILGIYIDHFVQLREKHPSQTKMTCQHVVLTIISVIVCECMNSLA